MDQPIDIIACAHVLHEIPAAAEPPQGGQKAGCSRFVCVRCGVWAFQADQTGEDAGPRAIIFYPACHRFTVGDGGVTRVLSCKGPWLRNPAARGGFGSGEGILRQV